jgi:hypothetical protein
MKQENFESILHYKKYSKWPNWLQPSGNNKKMMENKKKVLKRAASNYIFQNNTLYIKKEKVENEAQLKDSYAAAQKVEEGSNLEEGNEYEVNRKIVPHYLRVVPTSLQESFLRQYHGGTEESPSSHWGIHRMVAAMRRDGLYWHGQ